jgi:hypothetical protein
MGLPPEQTGFYSQRSSGVSSQINTSAERQQLFFHITELSLMRKHLKHKEPHIVNIHLIDLLAITKDFKATDPRDKVFGIVRLACNTGPGIIGYERSMADILIDVTKFALQAEVEPGPTTPLDVLSLVVSPRMPQPAPLGLPSWVPPFHDYPTSYYPLHVRYRSRLMDLEYQVQLGNPFSFSSDNVRKHLYQFFSLFYLVILSWCDFGET